MTSPSPSPAFAVSAGVLLAGTAGYGVWRLARLWTERERPATGYVAGKAFTILVVGIDGKPVEVATAAAFRRMRDAAAADGVAIKVVGLVDVAGGGTSPQECRGSN